MSGQGSEKKAFSAKAKEFLKFVLKFSLAFLIIGYMIYSGRLDVATVKRGFSNPTVIGLSLFLIIFGSVVAILRWHILLKGQGVALSFAQALRYGFIGIFFNTTMPGVVSGDIVKAWYVIADRPKGMAKTPVLTAIVIDRIIGLFGLIIVSMISMLLYWQTVWGNPQLHSLALFNFAMGLGVITFFLFVAFSETGPFAWFRARLERLRANRVGAIFLKAYDAWLAYRKTPTILWGSLALSAVTHSCVVLAILFCSRALGEADMQVYQIFLLAPIGLLTIALPIAPAGLGVGHVAFNALFISVGSRLGAEIFTMFISLQILVNLSGAFFYLRAPKPMVAASV